MAVRFKDAVSDCTAALRLDSANLKARLRRARCNVKLGQFDQAVRDFDQALADMRSTKSSKEEVAAGACAADQRHDRVS